MSNTTSAVALCGRQLDPRVYDRLSRAGYSVIELPENDYCYKPVNNHPDVYVCSLLENQKWIIAPQLLGFIKEEFSRLGCLELLDVVSCGSKMIGKTYPETSVYNVVEIGNSLILRKKGIDSKIFEFAENHEYSLLNVNQGYVRCTTIAINQQVLMTSDRSIEKRLLEAGKEVLYVQPEGIKLEGFLHGFIGGCSFLLPNNILFFYGDISQHEQFESILSFAKKHEYTCEWLPDQPLEDIGGVIFLTYNTSS